MRLRAEIIFDIDLKKILATGREMIYGFLV